LTPRPTPASLLSSPQGQDAGPAETSFRSQLSSFSAISLFLSSHSHLLLAAAGIAQQAKLSN
jgi:hypothetical protein